MNDSFLSIILLVILGLVITASLLYFAAGLILAFTLFTIKLPKFIMIIMFIFFPPTLIVFLTGLFIIDNRFGDKLVSSDTNKTSRKNSTQRKISSNKKGEWNTLLTERDKEEEKRRRQSLGYDQ